MLTRTHKVAGALAAAVVVHVAAPQTPLAPFLGAVAAGWVAGHMPDWDLHLPLCLVFSHRGGTHTLWALAAVALALYLAGAPAWLALGALAAYLSHLLLDAPTVHGIYPLGSALRWRIHGPLCVGDGAPGHGRPLGREIEHQARLAVGRSVDLLLRIGCTGGLVAAVLWHTHPGWVGDFLQSLVAGPAV